MHGSHVRLTRSQILDPLQNEPGEAGVACERHVTHEVIVYPDYTGVLDRLKSEDR